MILHDFKMKDVVEFMGLVSGRVSGLGLGFAVIVEIRERMMKRRNRGCEEDEVAMID